MKSRPLPLVIIGEWMRFVNMRPDDETFGLKKREDESRKRKCERKERYNRKPSRHPNVLPLVLDLFSFVSFCVFREFKRRKLMRVTLAAVTATPTEVITFFNYCSAHDSWEDISWHDMSLLPAHIFLCVTCVRQSQRKYCILVSVLFVFFSLFCTLAF